MEKFSWVECVKCSVIYMNPVPDQKSYQIFYKEHFWDILSQRISDSEDKNKKEITDSKIIEYQKKSEKTILEKRIPKIVSFLQGQIDKDSKVLEVGSSWGTSLNYLQKNYGCDVFAIEPSKFATEILVDKYQNINLIADYIEDLDSNNEYNDFFDIIIFSHSLENIVSQNNTLSIVKNILRTNGLVYIDMCSLYWHDYTLNPFHPFVYTYKSLENMLSVNGFSIVKHEYSNNPKKNILYNYFINFFVNTNEYITVLVEQSDNSKNINREHHIKTKFNNAQLLISLKKWIERFCRKFINRIKM